MTRSLNRLKALEVSRIAREPAQKVCMYHDGGGLYLRITPPSAASWVLRYMLDGAARNMGLGSYPEISLQRARELAQEARRIRATGSDPLNAKRQVIAERRAREAQAKTFKECAEAYIASHTAGWKNAKHADQWTKTLAAYAFPLIGEVPVSLIDSPLVMDVLEQPVTYGEGTDRFWTARPETASRVRGRIEQVLGWAAARGYRQGDNPARWKGQLEHQLPARGRFARVQHHAALPFDELPNFMAALSAQGGIAARALEFTILTATRTGEVLGASYCELNLGNSLWAIPAHRMKAGKEHRVPLCREAIALVDRNDQSGHAPTDYLFPGMRVGKPLTNMAMLNLLKRMGYNHITTHGFRSTFRDWAAETTSFSSEVIEMALAHTISNKVEAAYRRGDLFEKRIELMLSWSNFALSMR